jgi:hypothetical protein
MAFILAIDGPEGSGKTSLALSAYELFPPVTYLDLDGNAWIALNRFKEPVEQGLIKVEMLGDLGEDGDDVKLVKEAWAWIRGQIREALAKPGTLVLDTADVLLHLVRMEKMRDVGYPKADRISPKDYAPANAWMDNFFARCKKSPCNIILVHRAEHPWVQRKVGDKWEMGYDEELWKRARAYTHTGFALHASVLTTKEVTSPTKVQKERAVEVGRKEPKASLLMTAVFTECKVDPLLINVAVINPTFKKLWDKMFPSEEE